MFSLVFTFIDVFSIKSGVQVASK